MPYKNTLGDFMQKSMFGKVKLKRYSRKKDRMKDRNY